MGVFRSEVLSLRISPPAPPFALFPDVGLSPISASTVTSPLIGFRGIAAPGGVGGCGWVGVLLPRRPIRFHSDDRCEDDAVVDSLGGFGM